MLNKLGFHSAAPNDQLLNLITRWKPSVVKMLDHSPDFIEQIHKASPDTTIICRLVKTASQQDEMLLKPRESAKAFAQEIRALEVNSIGVPLIWEGLNEVFSEQESLDRQTLYNEWMVTFFVETMLYGITPMAFNFATGNFPNPNNPVQFVETYFATLSLYNHIGVHEYDWPEMWRLHEQGIADGNDGMWLCLRYRRLMEAIKSGFSDKKFNVWVTECGMTQGVQGFDDVGWKANPAITNASYHDSLEWYNSELLADDYIKGSGIFCVVSGAGWDTFETIDEIDTLFTRIEQNGK